MSNETEMRAILQELHDKFGMRVYGTSSYIKKDMRDRIAAALVMPTQAPAATEAPSKPFAYYIHIAAEQRGEFVHDLDEALDDLTNCECKITELFDHATTAPAVGASPEPVKRDEAEHAAWRTDYAKGAAQMLRRWPTPPADAVTDGTSDVRENALARGIRALMRRLAPLLDEDQFKDCEDIVRQAGVTPAAPEVDPTAIYSNLGRVAFEAMNPGKVFTYLPAHEMQRWEAAAEAVRMAAPVYAWEATTIGYKRFVTDDWYRKSSDAVKRWYKPFRCSSCAAVPASVQPVLASLSDAIDGPRYRWLRANREAQAEDGTLLDVYDEDGTMLSHESLDRAIDAALASSTPTKGGEAS